MIAEINLESSGGGATGFSSLARGVVPQNVFVPFISTSAMGGDRTLSARPGITRGGEGRAVETARTIGRRNPTLRDRLTEIIIPPRILMLDDQGEPIIPRQLSARAPISRSTGGRDVEVTRGISARMPMSPRDSGRAIAEAGTQPNGNAGQQAGTNQPRTPFDENIDSLFRGFFGEPVQGRGDKGGEFVFIPPASGGDGNTGLLFVVLAGAGVVGFFIWKKMKGGS